MSVRACVYKALLLLFPYIDIYMYIYNIVLQVKQVLP
jgi:hypothetical protein